MAFVQRFGPVLLVAACAALSLGACGGGDNSPTQVNTTFGWVQGVDDSAATGTYAWSEDSPLLPEKSTSMFNGLNIVHAAQNGSRSGRGRRGPDSFS
jgi:hypothetical protein